MVGTSLHQDVAHEKAPEVRLIPSAALMPPSERVGGPALHILADAGYTTFYFLSHTLPQKEQRRNTDSHGATSMCNMCLGQPVLPADV